MSINPWIRLQSGKKFHILNPRPSEICIEDIAHNLSHICRYTGASKKFYSVAEHAINCSLMAPDELALEALLHDSSESYIGDMNSPLKSVMPQYREVERNIEYVIAKKFGTNFPMPTIVKEIDLAMLATEMKVLLPGNDWKNIPYDPFNIRLACWDSKTAKKQFIKRFKQLI